MQSKTVRRILSFRIIEILAALIIVAITVSQMFASYSFSSWGLLQSLFQEAMVIFVIGVFALLGLGFKRKIVGRILFVGVLLIVIGIVILAISWISGATVYG